MSHFSKNQIFNEPQTKQYGSHMVMTNVQKELKTKYISIDTANSEEYNSMKTSVYNISLPERTNEVKQLCLKNIEIPLTYFNISENLGNNYFRITISGTSEIIKISDANYTSSTLKTAIDTALAGKNLTCTLTENDKSSFTASSGTITIDFDVDQYGNKDKYNLKHKLGWLLGFRSTSYEITATTTSEAFLNLHGPNYLYLALDEYSKSGANQNYLYPKIKDYLDIVFENDLFTGIKYLFENNTFENMPIYNSNGKTTSFYIFENNNWTKLSTEKLNKYIEQITEEFMFVFNSEWIQVNQEKLLTDETFQQNYMKYIEKFVGNSPTHQEKINSQLKPFLSKLLKV